jgi:hypothetical protein
VHFLRVASRWASFSSKEGGQHRHDGLHRFLFIWETTGHCHFQSYLQQEQLELPWQTAVITHSVFARPNSLDQEIDIEKMCVEQTAAYSSASFQT